MTKTITIIIIVYEQYYLKEIFYITVQRILADRL